MTQPTQAQIDAAFEVVSNEARWSLNKLPIVKRMLIAAAQVKEQDALAIRYGMQSGGDLWKATIERCAQVADDLAVDDPDGWCKLVAATIRKLKDAP